MIDKSHLVFKNSPFLPRFDTAQIVSLIKMDIERGYEPAAAIALAVCPLMDIHKNNLLSSPDLLSSYNLQTKDIEFLNYGYVHPLCAILASSVCKIHPKEQRAGIYESLVTPTIKIALLELQHQILEDLNATINILKIDQSGALIFQYLKDFPFSPDEYFANGMEIAAIVFFGVSLEVAKAIGDSSWLNVPYDPTALG